MRGEALAALDTAARDDTDAWVREEARLARAEEARGIKSGG
jgi:hypothetical protein